MYLPNTILIDGKATMKGRRNHTTEKLTRPDPLTFLYIIFSPTDMVSTSEHSANSWKFQSNSNTAMTAPQNSCTLRLEFDILCFHGLVNRHS